MAGKELFHAGLRSAQRVRPAALAADARNPGPSIDHLRDVPPKKFFEDLARVAGQNGILRILDGAQSGTLEQRLRTAVKEE
jgi:hypothetical protein